MGKCCSYNTLLRECVSCVIDVRQHLQLFLWLSCHMFHVVNVDILRQKLGCQINDV